MTDFQSKKMNITFADCDNSEISRYIYDYLSENHNVKRMNTSSASLKSHNMQLLFIFGDFWELSY